MAISDGGLSKSRFRDFGGWRLFPLNRGSASAGVLALLSQFITDGEVASLWRAQGSVKGNGRIGGSYLFTRIYLGGHNQQ